MNLWSQDVQRRGNFSQQRPNAGSNMQRDSARLLSQALSRQDFNRGDFLFERRNISQLADDDYDMSLSNSKMGRSNNWADDDRRGMNRPGDMPQKNNFNQNVNWMDDDIRGMSRSMQSDNFMSPQNNFNQNRMWTADERRAMSILAQSDKIMNNQNNFNRGRVGWDGDSGDITPLMEHRNSMNQNNFNQGRMWTGNERRGTKRPMENNYANNSNRDRGHTDDKRSRQNEVKPAPESKQNTLWDQQWNATYPEFRIPGNYKSVLKWEKCLQPQNAIQIYNQMVRGGVEIPCKQLPRVEYSEYLEQPPAKFIAHAKLNGKMYEGTGNSKKLAQQHAAENALKGVFKLMMNKANKITKESGIVEIDRNDLIPWNYITSLALFKFLLEMHHQDAKPAAAASAQKSKDTTPPGQLPPNAVELNPYRLLLKMKPGILITPVSDDKDPNVVFEVEVDGKRYTGSGKLPQEARRDVAKNVLSGLYGLVYPEEKPLEPLPPGEMPKNAVHWNPYKLMLRMKPDVVVNRVNDLDETDEDVENSTIKLEVEIDGKRFTEIGKTMTEARTALGRVVCENLYGIVYPFRQQQAKGEKIEQTTREHRRSENQDESDEEKSEK